MASGTAPVVVVCGLGPGNPDSVTGATREALSNGDPIFLRTDRHPSASLAFEAHSYQHSFDSLYEQAESFEEIYIEIGRLIVGAALDQGVGGRIVYAVPGSPLVLERSVREVRRQGELQGVEVQVLPALSFLDEVWARLGVDPIDDGVRLIDGHRFSAEAADQRGPLLVAHAHARWVLSDIKLAIDAGDEQKVIVLKGLGTPEEDVTELAWPDLDRLVEPDHLTSLYIPSLASPVGRELAQSVDMMARLRSECPWDRDQDHRSLRRFLIEEAYEVVEAIDRLTKAIGSVEAADETGMAGDRSVSSDEDVDRAYQELEEELGDLLFQVLFHSELATEAGQFTLADVARTLTEKMVHRHPHVYGPSEASSVRPDEASWEELKSAEKSRVSAMDDLPAVLPALSLADKMLKRSQCRPDLGLAADEIERLLPEGSSPDEFALLALALVARSRDLGVASEQALRDLIGQATERYRRQEASGSLTADWVRG